MGLRKPFFITTKPATTCPTTVAIAAPAIPISGIPNIPKIKIGSRTKKNNPNKDNQEYLKELEEENLRLRIENAFLKEARRMRLEDEAKMRERLDSLAVSEDNSD